MWTNFSCEILQNNIGQAGHYLPVRVTGGSGRDWRRVVHAPTSHLRRFLDRKCVLQSGRSGSRAERAYKHDSSSGGDSLAGNKKGVERHRGEVN